MARDESSAADADRSADADADAAPPVRHLALKATALLALTAVLLCGAVLYVMYARGVFAPTQQLVLVAENSEGVVVGMDLTFSGFPIGRVRRIELGPEGNARILIDVPRQDARWLRTSSVFTLVRGLVGGTTLRAYSGILADPPLPDGAVRPVLGGDATAEIPRLMASARELLENLTAMTGSGSALSTTLDSVQALTGRLNGPGGLLGALVGDDALARKALTTLDRTNALLARLDAMTARADTQFFGPQGMVPELRATVGQLRALLGQARGSLQQVDAVLVEAQAVGANARAATENLAPLRAEVESSLRKVDQLIDEVNRKWPFKREAEIRLP